MDQAEKHEVGRYLLGQLSEMDEEQVELRLLTDAAYAEEFDVIVDEITDEYVANEFQGEERKRVEQYFFRSEDRRNKLKFGRSLGQAAKEHHVPPHEPSWFERFRAFWRGHAWLIPVAATVTVVAVAGALWFSHSHPPQTFVELSLAPIAGNRAEGTQGAQVPLSLNADALRITLNIPESLPPATSYRVESSKNGTTKSLELSGQGAHSVTVIIPATQLTLGQYTLHLFAKYADGTDQRVTYLFTVQ